MTTISFNNHSLMDIMWELYDILLEIFYFILGNIFKINFQRVDLLAIRNVKRI